MKMCRRWEKEKEKKRKEKGKEKEKEKKKREGKGKRKRRKRKRKRKKEGKILRPSSELGEKYMKNKIIWAKNQDSYMSMYSRDRVLQVM